MSFLCRFLHARGNAALSLAISKEDSAMCREINTRRSVSRKRIILAVSFLVFVDYCVLLLFWLILVDNIVSLFLSSVESHSFLTHRLALIFFVVTIFILLMIILFFCLRYHPKCCSCLFGAKKDTDEYLLIHDGYEGGGEHGHDRSVGYGAVVRELSATRHSPKP